MLKSVFAQLLQEGGRLHDNKMAKYLYETLSNNDFIIEKREDPENNNTEIYFGKQDRISSSDIIKYPDTDMAAPPKQEKPDKPKDFRFTTILINGIKKIPVTDSYKRLIFSRNNKNVTSAIILGNNGVGKSTFYGALEFIGMGQMKTAELYGIDRKSYLKNHFAGNQQAKGILNTVSNPLSLNYERPTANCVPAFFISEWDIREMEKLEDYGDFIFAQLGIENFRNLIKMLKSVGTNLESASEAYRTILSEEEKYMKENNDLTRLLIENIIPQKIPEEEPLSKLWEEYHEKPKALVERLMDIHKKLTNCLSEKEKSEIHQLQIDNPEEKITLLEEISTSLLAEFNHLIASWLEGVLNPLLTELLSEYLKDEDETIELTYDEVTMSIAVDLKLVNKEIPDDNTGTTTPRQYFNMFRFKMFVVSLKIALACCAKVIYKQNWPIVIDDIFNSSDFNNRTHMGEYISRICQTYKGLEDVGKMKLQLILFTQDDVIGEAVYHGLVDEEMDASLLRLHEYRCFNKTTPEEYEGYKYIDVGKEIQSLTFQSNETATSEDKSSATQEHTKTTSSIITSLAYPLILPAIPWMLPPSELLNTVSGFKYLGQVAALLYNPIH